MATATGADPSSSGAPRSADGSSRQHGRVRPRPRRFPLLLLVVLAAVAVTAARPLAVQTLRITSGSMAPTLLAGQRVLVDKLTYDLQDVRRGDIIAFEDPERPGQIAIKRVVALPQDTVTVRAGTLLVNGRQQREDYLSNHRSGADFYGPTIVPSGHLFVLGDNRDQSVDSRFSPDPSQ
jgi:signal peptidase I